MHKFILKMFKNVSFLTNNHPKKNLFVLSIEIEYKIVYTYLYAKSVTIHNLIGFYC